MGTGTGNQALIRSAERSGKVSRPMPWGAGLEVPAKPRAWAKGRKWGKAGLDRPALVAPLLNDDERAAVERVALAEMSRCDSEIALAAIGGRVAEVGGGKLGNGQVVVWDAARASAAMTEARHVIAWAASLGVDLGNLVSGGAGSNHAVARRTEAERGQPCDMARRSARFEALCEAFAVPHGVGSNMARARRAERAAMPSNLGKADSCRLPSWLETGFVGPVRPWQRRAVQSGKAARLLVHLGGSVGGRALGPWVPSVSPFSGLAERARRLSDLCDAFGAPRPFGLAEPVQLTLAAAMRRAESCGKKWVRGSSSKAAADKSEIGAAAAADDVGAYFVRLESEAAGIARGVWLDSIAPRVHALSSAGVRINRRIRRELVAPLAVKMSVSRVLVGPNGKRSRVRVPALPEPVQFLVLALSCGGVDWLSVSVSLLLSRPVHVVGWSNPALKKATRKACEAWEYAAVRGRDGREVAGDWKLQGAVHGLRDFSLVAPQGATSDESPTDDMGAAEWSAMLDAAAARIGQARENDRAAQLVAEGYSEKLAARIAADETAATSGESERAAVDLGGIMRFAPDSGAGSGMPGWVADSIRAACDSARAALAERLEKARPQDKAKIAESDGAAVDLLAALESWIDGGEGLSAEQAADWLAGWDKQAEAWSDAARQRFSRLRKRAGIVKRDSPLAGKVATHGRGTALDLGAAGLASLVRRRSAWLPSDEGPALSDEQAARVAAMVSDS